jgi:hypothetical protein
VCETVETLRGEQRNDAAEGEGQHCKTLSSVQVNSRWIHTDAHDDDVAEV